VGPVDEGDRVEQLGRLGALAEEAARAGPQRLEDVLVDLERGEDEDVYAGEVLIGGDESRRGEPVEVGHPDVHQYDVGARLPGKLHRLPAGGRLADHLEIGCRVDEYRETLAYQRLVVGEEYPDGHAVPPGTGRVASTRNPPPGRGPARNPPPTAATRSRIPVMPWPSPGAATAPSLSTTTRSASGRYTNRSRTVVSPACL